MVKSLLILSCREIIFIKVKQLFFFYDFLFYHVQLRQQTFVLAANCKDKLLMDGDDCAGKVFLHGTKFFFTQSDVIRIMDVQV